MNNSFLVWNTGALRALSVETATIKFVHSLFHSFFKKTDKMFQQMLEIPSLVFRLVQHRALCLKTFLGERSVSGAKSFAKIRTEI